MNTGAKLAIAGVGTAVVVIIIYAMIKKSAQNAPAVSNTVSTPPPPPVVAKTNAVIDTSSISKSSPVVNDIETGGHMAVKTYPNESGLRAYRDKV